MTPADTVRIGHMVDAIGSAMRFTKGRTRADLDRDEMLAFALTRAIKIIGEAAARVGAATRERHAAIPWAEIVGMRHRLVHAYFDIDRDILWTTATEALPGLLPLLNFISSTR